MTNQHTPAAVRFAAKCKRAPTGCLLWTGTHDKHGYGYFYVGGKRVRAARWAWDQAHPEQPAGDLNVCHRCDTPPCVEPTCLFLGTDADNIADRDRKGRQARGVRNGYYTCPDKRVRLPLPSEMARGERHGRAKLTEVQVLAMRAEYAAGGCTQVQLAEKYGTSRSAVGYVVRGETWTEATLGIPHR